jgi:hypothetical protein
VRGSTPRQAHVLPMKNPHPPPLPAEGEATLRAAWSIQLSNAIKAYRACRLFSTASRLKFITDSCHATRLVCSFDCGDQCHPSGVLCGAVAHPGSHHFAYSTAAGSIDGNRKGWLQQTPAHSRNRVREWRRLSLSRRAACDLSRPYVGRVKGTILRLQRQGPLPIHSDSAAAKATSSREKSFGLSRIIREEVLYLCLFACLAVVPRLRDEGGCSFVVKKNWRFKFGEARQRFRLTPTEIRVAAFVVAAFALGLITKCYRDAHQSPSLPQPNKTRTKFASPAPASTPARKRTGKARKQSPQPSSAVHVPETSESER